MRIRKIGSLDSNLVDNKVRIRGLLKYSQKEKKDFISGSITDDTGIIYFSAFTGDKWLKTLVSVQSESHVVIEGILSSVTEGKGKNLKKLKSILSVSNVTPDIMNIDEGLIKERLTKAFKNIKDKNLKTLVKNCMNRGEDGTILPPKTKSKPFFISPASQYIFGYKGGLSIYTARVLDAVEWLLANTTNEYKTDTAKIVVDYDILITSIFLHNIGAINSYEISAKGILTETTSVKLVGKKNITRNIIDEEMNRVNLDFNKKLSLIHIITTCENGKERWNKELSGKTIETAILHSAIEHVNNCETVDVLSAQGQRQEFVTDSNGFTWYTCQKQEKED